MIHSTPVIALFRRYLTAVSLRRRVAALSTFAVTIAVVVTGVSAYATTRIALYNELDTELTVLARSAATTVGTDVRGLGGLTGEALQAGNVSVAVISAQGSVTMVPDEAVTLTPGAEELVVARLQLGSSARTATASNGQPYRMVAVPIPGLDYALVLGRPLAATDLILRSLWVVLVIFGAVAIFLAGVVGSAVARSGLRPVRRLTDAVEQVAATDDLAPIAVSGRDELSRLADSYNRMVRSLSRSRDRQRQLVADAGHELRTPLTSLRTNIELLAADASSPMLPPHARAEILTDVSAQLMEFTALIGDLVQLARDEEVTPRLEQLDFRDVVNTALERARRRGPGLQFDVELNPLYLVGESDVLERAITNLLDNAVKWSPPGGTIRVQLEGDRLRIADEGPGIATEDLSHVFDRFFRAESSRNTPGTGLGLSIVAQAAARHGGWVRASHSAQGGAEFTFRLPGSTTPPEGEESVIDTAIRPSKAIT